MSRRGLMKKGWGRVGLIRQRQGWVQSRAFLSKSKAPVGICVCWGGGCREVLCSGTGDSGGGRRPSRLGLLGHIKMFFVWIYGLFACFSTLFSVQRETIEVFEAEQPMSGFVIPHFS